MYKEALKLRDAGLSIIPTTKDKRPFFSLLPQIEEGGQTKGTWIPFKERLATDEELYKWFKMGKALPAIVGGWVSGQLCQMDFDDHKQLGCVYGDWFELVKKEFDSNFCESLVIHKTPGNGYHVRWRVDTEEVLASGDIAVRWIPGKNPGMITHKTDTIIEARSEGEYALSPPSHGYQHVQGSLLELPIISYKSHQRLVAIAEMFHIAVEVNPQKTAKTRNNTDSLHGLSPGDDFNERGDHGKLLIKHGWTLAHSNGSKEYWKHPTTEHATSATWNCMPELPNRFYCFSPNTPFTKKKPYHKFAIYAVLECDGDFILAAKRLAEEGYGEQSTPKSAPTNVGETDYTPLGDEVIPEAELDNLELNPLFPKDPPLDLSALVPHISWLKRYMDYIYPTIDAPDQFGLACGMSVISMACQNMFVQFGQNAIRPNIWLAIIAPSSLYRKSSSISIAKRMIKSYDENNEFAAEQSPEAFVNQMAGEDGQAFGTFFWQEMSSQLEVFEKRGYMSGYKAMLTDLYDCPDTYTRRTIKDGALIVKRPFINIMTASTQVWLNECLSEGNMKGGFLPRFTWITATERKRFLPFPDKPDFLKEQELIEDLHEFSRTFAGGMTVDDEARDVYVGYATELDRQGREAKEYEGLIGAFYSRLSTYSIKFALLYQAMIQDLDDPSRIIGPEAMEYATRYTDYLKANINSVLSNMTWDDDNRDLLRVKQYIQLNPGVSKSQLLRAIKMKTKLLNECLETLIEAKVIGERLKKSASGRGRSTRKFFLMKGGLDE